MSITPAIPVLRAGKRTRLHAAQGELVLHRSGLEHHIPLAAVARVHAERRAVEVTLTAPAGTVPTVYRVDGVSEIAAGVFARAVSDLLDPTAGGSEVPDGSALVTTRTAEREAITSREAFGRKVKRLVWGAVLAIVAMSVLVSFVTHPVIMLFAWILGGTGFGFAICVVLLAPSVLERWRLPRHGITVTAYSAAIADRPGLYLYGDQDGNTRTYVDTSGRLSIEVSYDPSDPGTVVRADGKGRAWPTAVLLFTALIALLLLAGFCATPFMTP
ncbi:hypothetical protein GCM10010329_62620 [Streptomyces spiroverticillatus]|nr:hypothetical protein GCM10010329_62620 [Streptomyces spiroverticillatus]